LVATAKNTHLEMLEMAQVGFAVMESGFDYFP
jgi:hypothetical protein